jgi:hypothetical protein
MKNPFYTVTVYAKKNYDIRINLTKVIAYKKVKVSEQIRNAPDILPVYTTYTHDNYTRIWLSNGEEYSLTNPPQEIEEAINIYYTNRLSSLSTKLTNKLWKKQ